MLFQDWKTWLDQTILDKQTMINTEIMGQLMSGVEEQMGPFEALATKFRNWDTGVEQVPEPIKFLTKKEKKGATEEEKKKDNPWPQWPLQKNQSSKSDQEMKDTQKEEEKKEEVMVESPAAEGKEVTSLKSLNMDDVMNKTQAIIQTSPW